MQVVGEDGGDELVETVAVEDGRSRGGSVIPSIPDFKNLPHADEGIAEGWRSCAGGRKAEAIQFAEASRGKWTNDHEVDRACEDVLLSSGLAGEAYRRYGVRAARGGTFLATFRALAKRYPGKAPGELLRDLVASTPGEEGKWFAAAKEAGLYDEALASRTPTDPKTLTRAARDHVKERPEFALGAGLAALRWLAHGYGYEVTGADVWSAWANTLDAARVVGREVGFT